MNTTSPLLVELAPTQLRVERATAKPRGTRTYRPVVYTFCTLAVLVANYLSGKELGWDTLNYHLYAGFSAVNDRFGQDYFAAGPQSYFNPYAYVPFYLLVKAGLPALIIASVLAAAHSAILWLTFELGVSVCPSTDSRTRAAAGFFAATIAFVNPVLLQQFGTSFADITTGELVLAGWVLLASTIRSSGDSRVVCAGLILGAASALKLTNIVHAIAAIAMLIVVPLTTRGLVRYAISYTLSLGVGFTVVAAPWSYRLARMFGNPLFPLMNGFFRSPEYTTGTLRHFRFIPDSLADALWRPFAMVDPFFMVHEELRAPDLRYAVLMVLVAALLIRWSWRRRAGASHPPQNIESAISTRVLAALGCGFATDWVLWLTGSGNSRYFLPMACVAAALIVGLFIRVFALQPKIRNYVLLVLFGVQAIQLAMGADFRWNAVPWGGPWIDIDIPKKLQIQPSLYLTIGMLSNSFVAPYVAEGSGMVNFAGGYAFGSQGVAGSRVNTLIARYAPNVRVLVTGEKIFGDEERRSPRLSQVNIAVSRFNLRVDADDCTTVTINGLPPDLEITFASSTPAKPNQRDKTFLVSCHLIPDLTSEPARIEALRASKDMVLDRLEDACPKLFQPRRSFTEYNGFLWSRRYGNTDLTAWVSRGEVKFVQGIRGADMVHVGHEAGWASFPQTLICGRRNGVYYGKLLGPG